MFRTRHLPLRTLCASLLFALLLSPAAMSAAEPLFQTVCLFPVTPDNKPNYRIPAILQAQNGDILVFA